MLSIYRDGKQIVDSQRAEVKGTQSIIHGRLITTKLLDWETADLQSLYEYLHDVYNVTELNDALFVDLDVDGEMLRKCYPTKIHFGYLGEPEFNVEWKMYGRR